MPQLKVISILFLSHPCKQIIHKKNNKDQRKNVHDQNHISAVKRNQSTKTKPHKILNFSHENIIQIKTLQITLKTVYCLLIAGYEQFIFFFLLLPAVRFNQRQP